MINSIFIPVTERTFSLYIRQPNPDRSADDRVHYWIPKSKYHTLNFTEPQDEYCPTLGKNQPIHLIDGLGVIRIETKNSRGVNYSVSDSAYIFSQVDRVGPRSGQTGGWVPIPITDINFEDYEILRSKGSSRLVGCLLEGMFGPILATHGRLESLILNFTRPLTDEEIKAREERIKKSPFAGLRQSPFSAKMVMLIHDGEKYFIKSGGELKDKTSEEKLKSKEWRVVASIYTSPHTLNAGDCFDEDIRTLVFLRLECINHDDLIAIFGNKIEFIKVEKLDQLDASHFAPYSVLVEESQHPRDTKYHLAIIHDAGGNYTLYRPSRSDITNLDHTLTLLRKGVKHDDRSELFN